MFLTLFLVLDRLRQRVEVVLVEIVSEFHVAANIGSEAGILLANVLDECVAAFFVDLTVRIAVTAIQAWLHADLCHFEYLAARGGRRRRA